MVASIRLAKDKSGTIVRRLKQLREMQLLVGVSAESNTKGVGAGEMGNAAKAFINDKGDPSVNIPARPFMEPAAAEVRDDVEARLRKAALAFLNGNTRMVIQHLSEAGLQSEQAVQAAITDGDFVPLAPFTIAKRRERGNFSEQPLIDTAAMRQSIVFLTNYPESMDKAPGGES